jgi:hypothetical protein
MQAKNLNESRKISGLRHNQEIELHQIITQIRKELNPRKACHTTLHYYYFITKYIRHCDLTGFG